MNEEQLQQAIAIQESLRGTVPDAIIDATIAVLKNQFVSIAPTPAKQHTAERKQVTILFADLSGFTAMSETMDAEDVRETMNALWNKLDSVIEGHNGRIDKHIGDAVMALWGTGQAREDDPEQAIRAALSMQTAVETFSEQSSLATSLKMRIGINTGPALLGEVGTTGEYTAMGDTVNTASRLEHAAPLGQILISHDTYRHVRGIFQVIPQEPLSVKGKTEPIQTYVVSKIRPRAFRLSTRGVEGIETKMIGRDTELTQLQDAFQTALSEKIVMITTISGEAGVGKSRLLYEFDKWLHLFPEDFWYFKGRAIEQTTSSPYALLRDLFAFRFQIRESDNLAVVWEKMEAGFQKFVPEDPILKAHILGMWLGYDFSESPHVKPIAHDASQLHDRATLFLHQFFHHSTKTHPTVILLEDIHWADTASLDAVKSLYERTLSIPLFIVCLARPNLIRDRPDWFKFSQLIALSPLNADKSHELVHEILKKVANIPPKLSKLIVERAEGNPFFVEELVKMLIDDGILDKSQEPWVIKSNKLEQFRVPQTLTGIIQARLDRLSTEAKNNLQRASVVGRTFWSTALVSIDALQSDLTQPTVLEELQQKEMVFSRPDTAFANNPEYIFKHALLRDVTYESILKKVRRVYHEHTANWLIQITQENKRTDEYAGQIGTHYELAGKLTDAQHWYTRAALLAVSLFAHQEAEDWITKALALTPEKAIKEQYTLLLAREKIFDFRGDRTAQQTDLNQLKILAEKLDPSYQTKIALRQAQLDEALGNYLSSVSASKNAIHFATLAADERQQASGFWQLGFALLRQGNYAEARIQFLRASEIADQIGAKQIMADSLRGLGNTSIATDDDSNGLTYYEQCLPLYREVGDKQGEGNALANIGIIALGNEQFDRAFSFFEQSLALFQEIGDRRRQGHVLNNLGKTAQSLGNIDTALIHLQSSYKIAREVKDKYWIAASCQSLADLLLTMNQQTEASDYLFQARDIYLSLNLNEEAELINTHLAQLTP